MLNPVIKQVEELLSQHAGMPVLINTSNPVGGGCINEAQQLKTTAGDFFIKMNDANLYPGMFEAEAKGLQLLGSVKAIRVPEVIGCGEADGQSFIVLEFIRSSVRGKVFWENFGSAMARLHQNTSDRFGLDHDNYIGSLPQRNRKHDDWLSFFINERLKAQAELAFNSGRITKKHIAQIESLSARLDHYFPDETPSLLHGDLWSGNFMTDDTGKACIMDPAVYYGHREAELAFTQLFGGFDSRFYFAYHEAYPLHPGFESRRDVYNLYPLLVHVNLFGGGYLSSVESILSHYAE